MDGIEFRAEEVPKGEKVDRDDPKIAAELDTGYMDLGGLRVRYAKFDVSFSVIALPDQAGKAADAAGFRVSTEATIRMLRELAVLLTGSWDTQAALIHTITDLLEKEWVGADRPD